jgi:glycosyltransferase involved in cell wall biosynthesis
MLEAFLALRSNGFHGWSYYTLGSIGSWVQDRAYFDEVADRAKTAEGDVHVLANVARETLALRYAEAKIFWHAAGFNDDQEKQPELMEHFGIATVDAMAAGCVPVVIKRGAQPEIVRHGVDGFLWETLDELKQYTRTLMEDDKLRAQMAAAAQERAKTFSRAAFVERFLSFIGEPSPAVTAR